MAKGINQKGKILYLEKILRETSETHPCTMQEIIENFRKTESVLSEKVFMTIWKC